MRSMPRRRCSWIRVREGVHNSGSRRMIVDGAARAATLVNPVKPIANKPTTALLIAHPELLCFGLITALGRVESCLPALTGRRHRRSSRAVDKGRMDLVLRRNRARQHSPFG
jgi:hypothetical protein